jgi:Na+/melibiose symporter-like transporter
MPPLTLRTKLWYALGQLGENIKNESFSYFLVFYYMQVLDLSGFLAGLAYFVSMIVDAFVDPLVGVLTDRTRSRLGRRHPWIFASALPLAITLYLVFSPPAALSQWALFAWMLVWTLANRFALTMFHVPYLALGAELSRDWTERTQLVQLRFTIAQAALVFPSVIGFFWLFRRTEAGLFHAPSYPQYAALAAVAVFVIVLLSAWHTRDRIPYLALPDAVANTRDALTGTLHDLRELLRQRSFRALFLGTAISSIASGLTLNLGVSAATFFWDLGPAIQGTWRLVVAFALIAGIAFWAKRAAIHEKAVAFNTGLLWYVGIHTAVWTAATYGFWPDRTHAAYVPLYLAGTALLGPFAVAAVFVTSQSMMADCADQDELESGRRREGVFFGAASFSQKITLGGGVLIGTAIAELIGLRGLKSIELVTPEMRLHLGNAINLSVLVLIGLSWFFFRQYDLTRARVAEIHARLEARRNA